MQVMRKYSSILAAWREKLYFPSQDSGFVLVVTMFVLIVLTIIGLSAISTTEIELQIAGNDRVFKETFYHGDGGTETGVQLIEENISCPKGFATPAGFNNDKADTLMRLQGVEIADAKFAFDEVISQMAYTTPPGPVTNPLDFTKYPLDTNRSIRIPMDPANPSDTDPHTNIAIWGETRLSAGSAIQMAAGYEGKGKSAGSSGAYIAYEIHSQHLGVMNSKSAVRLEWKHLVGQEGDCNY